MGNGNGFLNKTGGENKMKKVFCALLAALTLLEVKGLVTRLPGKRVGPRE